VRSLRAIGRLAAALIHALHGALICAVVFPRLTAAQRMQRVGWWSARMLAVLGIRWSAEGAAIAPGPLLIVANHVSWLDILAINALQPVRFVSKADVRHWPLLGWLVECGGTLFIERERKRDALRVVHQVADALRGGEIVAVFPEGTTSEGREVLPFHANLLQAVVATQAPVQPLALRYRDDADTFSRAAPYIGETTLLESMWAVACAEQLRVCITVGGLTQGPHPERRVLSEQLRHTIAAALANADCR
jgi:1-acyl-sn-glycerol-3-phosphate acyltransferase